MIPKRKGSFTEKAAQKVLDGLLNANLFGILRVSDGYREKEFLFGSIGFRLVVSDTVDLPDLGIVLLRQGLLSQTELDSAEREASSTDLSLREVLDHEELCTSDEIDEAVQEYVIGEFLDCLVWHEPYFESFEGERVVRSYKKREDLKSLVLSREPGPLAVELKSRLEPFEAVRVRVGSVRTAVMVTPEGKKLHEEGALPIGTDFTFSIIAGQEGILLHELAIETKKSLYEAAETLYKLAEVEAVEIAPLRDWQPTEEEIELRERAVGNAILPSYMHQQLGELYRKRVEKGRAASHFKACGVLYLESERTEEAVEVLRRALAADEEDFEAREAFVTALREIQDHDEAKKQALRLGKTYMDLGLEQRGRRVYEQVAEWFPMDVEADRRLLKHLFERGDHARIARKGKELLAKLKRMGKQKEHDLLFESLKRELKNAPGKLDDLLAGARGGGTRSTRFAGAVLAALILVGIILTGYELACRSLLHYTLEGSVPLLRSGEYKAVEERLKRVGNVIVLSRVAREMPDYMATLDALRLDARLLQENRGNLQWREVPNIELALDTCRYMLKRARTDHLVEWLRQVENDILNHITESEHLFSRLKNIWVDDSSPDAGQDLVERMRREYGNTPASREMEAALEKRRS